MSEAAAAHFCSPILQCDNLLVEGMRGVYYLADHYSGRHGEAVRQGHEATPAAAAVHTHFQKALVFSSHSIFNFYYDSILETGNRL